MGRKLRGVVRSCDLNERVALVDIDGHWPGVYILIDGLGLGRDPVPGDVVFIQQGVDFQGNAS